jgi:hypothetical protein
MKSEEEAGNKERTGGKLKGNEIRRKKKRKKGGDGKAEESRNNIMKP